MKQHYDALALFSGGLDSILAVKVIEAQGLQVLGLHFVSPFFGQPEQVQHWQKIYDINIEIVDVSTEFIEMMLAVPGYGFGKHLNPCVDCKILMVQQAMQLLDKYKAKFIISGEVVGQRPMSQRRDAMNSIRNASRSGELLLRPLSAFRLLPTLPEVQGWVDRDKLPKIWGRGRKMQLELAKTLGITEIPTPGGGCLLTEAESAKRYWPVFANFSKPDKNCFELANVGRQLWKQSLWLSVGRNKEDNQRLLNLAKDDDYILSLTSFPGPTAIVRILSEKEFSEELLAESAAVMAYFSPKARKSRHAVDVRLKQRGIEKVMSVIPLQDKTWREPIVQDMLEGKKRFVSMA